MIKPTFEKIIDAVKMNLSRKENTNTIIMIKFIQLTLCGLLITLLISCNKDTTSWHIISPNKYIKVEISRIETSNSNKLYYSVYIKNDGSYKQIIEPSPLGIIREESIFIENLQFISSKTTKNKKVEYSLLSGSKQKYNNTYNEISLAFTNYEQKNINLIFRAFNNGMAFQYFFPDNSIKQVRIVKEQTGFNLGDGNFWAHPYDTVTHWSPAYETFYAGPLKIGTNAPWNKNGWAFPMLFETNNCWVFISESGFDGSYGASHIHSSCEDGVYKIKSAEAEEAMGYYDNTSHAELPWKTPWRFITVGKTLADIVESHMATDLAFPNQIENTNWIKPGRSSWSWWSESDSPQDYERLVPFVDLAAEMGWEYSLVDANWNRMKNGSLEQLAKYAAGKNVGLLIWYNSGGKHNVVSEEPRDLMDKGEVRRQEFERISKLGIKGIKVDFFQSDKQKIIKYYIEILEDAADYQLVVNFHGCTLPKGWRRTYPNLLAMEAIRGGECYKFDENYPEKAPSHIATIPYLRGVAGPTDYTPGGFSNSTYPHLTTYGFELALPIIIESGITHYVETPEKIKSLPSFAINLLKILPVRWDETKYLAGYPGKEAVIARKKDNIWYVGGINGEDIEKNLKLNLSRIVPYGAEILIINDGHSSCSLESKSIILENNEIEVNMLPYGGFVCIIEIKI